MTVNFIDVPCAFKCQINPTADDKGKTRMTQNTNNKGLWKAVFMLPKP